MALKRHPKHISRILKVPVLHSVGIGDVGRTCAWVEMDISDRKRELMKRLRQLRSLMDRGFEVEVGASGDVAITRSGHVYGIWLVNHDGLAYVPGGYNEPTHFAASVEEAVAVTCEAFGARFALLSRRRRGRIRNGSAHH